MEPTQETQTTETTPVEPITDDALRQQAAEAAEKSVAPAPEKPAQKPTEEPAQSGLDAKKLALQVARLEKQYRDQKAIYDKMAQEHESIVGKLKDPDKIYSLIEEYGGNYSDWTSRLIEGKADSRDPRDLQLEKMAQKLEALQSQIEQKSQTEQQREKEKSMADAYAYSEKFIGDNKDKYPYLHALGGSRQLVQEAERMASEGLPIDENEIAQAIEGNVVQVIKKQVSELSKLEGFQKLLAEVGFIKSSKTNTPEIELPERDSDEGNNTLTNDLSGEPYSGFDYKNATPEELRQRAMKVAEHVEAKKRRAQQ